MSAETHHPLRNALKRLVEVLPEVSWCEGQGAVEDGIGGPWELVVAGGEALRLGLVGDAIEVRFAGWVERIDLALGTDSRVADGGSAIDESANEVFDLIVDFVAAALFGELRVQEEVVDDKILRRTLEVRVRGHWQVCSRRGGLAMRGLWAQLRGRLILRRRGNEGLVRRPKHLRGAKPSGLHRAPWSGAALGVSSENRPAPLAIDGELDLHNFAPKEVGPLVREYIDVCRERGLLELRIIHGKGKGVLRRTVHSLLADHTAVADYRLGGHGEGSWGATIVTLKSPAEAAEPEDSDAPS